MAVLPARAMVKAGASTVKKQINSRVTANSPVPPTGELFDSLGERGAVRALWVMGANPVVSAPRAALLEERLKRLDLLVVCDAFPSETALMADVVLPVTQW